MFNPGSRINLDEWMEKGSMPCFYTHIANENAIDVYSHEYDVMMMGTLEFKDAEGMATEFIQDGCFDCEGFQAKWKQNSKQNAEQDDNQNELDKRLYNIATSCMGQTDFDQNPGLKNALNEAYQLGKKAAQPDT